VEHEHAWPFTAFGHGEIAAGGLIVAVIRELLRCTIPHLKILLVSQNRLSEGVTLEQMIEIVKFVRAGTILGDRCFPANRAQGDVRIVTT
jgi:hypothetical protein